MIFTFAPGPHLNRAIADTAAHPNGAGFNEFLHAVADQQISVTAIMRHRAAWTPRCLRSSLPTIVLIGDDAGNSRDPAEWRCSMSVIAWARCAIVHGTGAQASHYREAIRGAQRLGRCLFIETDSAHVPGWVDTILPRGIPLLQFIPPSGRVHPAVEAVR
jgi:hypothetical protein